MILKYKGSGIFILQAQNLIPEMEYTQQFSYCFSQLLVEYIAKKCRLNRNDFSEDLTNDGLRVVDLTKRTEDVFLITLGVITSLNTIISKADKAFGNKEEIYLDISQDGLVEIPNTGETFYECEKAVYKTFEMTGAIKRGHILPDDYPFAEPAVRERRFDLFKTTRSLKDAVALYNMINEEDKTLYSDKNGMYGLKWSVYGEDIKRFESEFMCESTPFLSKMEPFTKEMTLELLSLYS